MGKYFLTYQDAQEIAKKYHNTNFREYQHIINGYKVAAFDYFICGWDDFEKPLPNKPEVNAFDMRGTTFVFNKDGSLYKKFLMLPKFFNINQVEATQLGNLKDKEVIDIVDKEDGSLVAFMDLPDGKLFAKTIGSFVSDQSQMARRFLYTWEEKVLYVKQVLKDGYTPLFEYVSGPNRIVLKYSKEDIKFLGLRNNTSGEWIPAHVLNKDNNIPFNIPETHKLVSLEELMEEAKTIENKEGWVVRLPDLMIKVKTAWYFKLHGLRTENVFREDYVIKNYLEKTLDDLMSQMDPKEDSDAFKFVAKVTGAINNWMDHIDNCTFKLKEKFETEYNSEMHYFAKFNHKEPYFMLARNLIEVPDEYVRRKIEMILKRTYRLKNAQELVERWKK